MTTLARADIRRFYDRFGAKQDAQQFYENAAVADLLDHLQLESARSVYEVGCGTGRIAAEMLARMPADATYTGVDISSTMVGLARERLATFAPRATVLQIDGSDPFVGCGDRCVDRIVSTYVLDLLPETEIERFLNRAAEFLETAGTIGVVSLTFGRSLFSRLVSTGWSAVFRIAPSLVGGCRPLRLSSYMPVPLQITHRAHVTSFGISSEIIVAERVESIC